MGMEQKTHLSAFYPLQHMVQKQSEMKVIFNVFKDLDYEIYKKLLQTN